MVGCPNWRIWLPALAAVACFATRARPTAEQTDRPTSRSVRLPPMYGLPRKALRQRFELRPQDSSVRFRVAGRKEEFMLDCRQATGELVLGPKPDDGSLTLRLDLTSLRRLSDDAGISMPDPPEVPDNLKAVYYGTLVSVASSDLPGIAETRWLGRIHFGSQVVSQPMRLWRAALPGQAIRLQGSGMLATESLGRSDRTAPGMFRGRNQITLGLDLAWRRSRN